MKKKVISIIVFSRDRALQLDATLSSFFRHCEDAADIPVNILYKATSEKHNFQYLQLISEYADKKNVYFNREKKFRTDTLTLITHSMDPGVRTLIYLFILKFGIRARNITRNLLTPKFYNFIVFLVDDNLFISDFCIHDAVEQLVKQEKAIGFSLRLGKNTTYCYMRGRNQTLPEFIEISPGILEYEWQKCQDDFYHVLEISSSIYRIKDIFPAIHFSWFATPNQLEAQLAQYRDKLSSLPKMLCYENSVTFCNPVNKVQTEFMNRSGEELLYSSEKLSDLFALGARIDIASFDGFSPNSCHQEVPMKFVNPLTKKPIV